MRQHAPRRSAAVAASRSRLGIPADAPVVGSIFRLNEEKRPFLWIETAREVAELRPDCHFVIFGAGPMRAKVHVAAGSSGLGGNLHCPGTIADTALGLSLLDLFLLTSRAEGTPNVVLEASALGIPVVATEAGGTREAIDEGVTGYLVEPAEPAVIAKRIAQVLQAADWRARVQAAGPAFVARRFGLDRMISETLALVWPAAGLRRQAAGRTSAASAGWSTHMRNHSSSISSAHSRVLMLIAPLTCSSSSRCT